MDEIKRQSNIKFAVTAFLATVVFVITYKYSLITLSAEGINDLKEHTWTAESIYLNHFWEVWLQRPYLFWHLCVKGFVKFCALPIEAAASCACASFAAINYGITVFFLDKIVFREIKKDGKMIAAVISAILSIVMPLYMYWFNKNQYIGQFSINTFFNPTHSAVKPFGVLAFIFAVDLIYLQKGKEPLFFKGKRIRRWLFLLFSAVLLLSTFTKPTFMYMLLPTGVLYLVIEFVAGWIRKDGSVRRIWNLTWKLMICCMPSLIYLGVEYAAFYIWGGTNSDASVAIYPFLAAWHLCSPNVLKSILLAMFFPLFMVITDFKYFIQSVEGRLAVLGYIVGTLEFSFFVETGSKLEHFNFAWPMMSGMLLLWVTAGGRLAVQTMDTNKKGNGVIVTGGWILLTVYMFSGFYSISPYQYFL